MPRKARIDASGALHHIIVRGIERSKIFYDDKDRDNFLQRLGHVLSETGTPCFAWALIPNHLHLLLRTGQTPIATVMRRLLTGYAISFNRRHGRHGHLFQNRYKSILCQENLYLLELVRYIHLNPLRVGLVEGLEGLDKYPYGGHSSLMGHLRNTWQDTDYILRFYGKRVSTGRQRYREFVAKGLAAGRRTDLIGGGLIRSAGGWAAVKSMRRGSLHVKGDERILGEGDFVEKALEAAQEKIVSSPALKAQDYGFEWLLQRVSAVLDIEPRDILAAGKYVRIVEARSLLCYWGVRKLGMTTVELSKKINLSQPSVSQAVVRGQKIAEEKKLNLLPPENQ
ncbi:MAG: transposase [Desulfobacterales bacterium]|nr:transposase [Desulfobacterales bacterium]